MGKLSKKTRDELRERLLERLFDEAESMKIKDIVYDGFKGIDAYTEDDLIENLNDDIDNLLLEEDDEKEDWVIEIRALGEKVQREIEQYNLKQKVKAKKQS
jgi:hypothetical protein